MLGRELGSAERFASLGVLTVISQLWLLSITTARLPGLITFYSVDETGGGSALALTAAGGEEQLAHSGANGCGQLRLGETICIGRIPLVHSVEALVVMRHCSGTPSFEQ